MRDQGDYQLLSSLEKKVYDWLVKNNILFNTQQTMFGMPSELGSATVDFIIPDRNLALRVMGGFWHSTLTALARDELSKERLIAAGYLVVDLWEENLTDERIDHTLRLALKGQEVLR